MKSIHVAPLAGALVLLARAAGAAPADPAPTAPTAPFEREHKPAKKPSDAVVLQLDDAEIGDLVKFIGEITGKRFVFGSPRAAKLHASVVAPQKITVAEAYQVFLAVLASSGLTVVPAGGFEKIVESQDIARQLTPLVGPDLPPEERYVTRIHRLSHLSAEEVTSTVLSKLQTKDASIIPYGQLLIITETAANVRRMLEVLEVIDQAGESDQLWLRPVRYLPSSQVEKELNEMLGLGKGKGDASGAGSSLHIARIVALERPNAIVVVGTKASYERVGELLDALDVAPSNEMKVQVVPLQNADAKKIVGPINEALGAGTATTAGRPASGAPPAAANAPAAAFEAKVTVSADETTNALIVSATARDFLYVREVIRALDRPKRQVFIEAAILEVSADRGLDVGVAWHGGSVDPTAIGPSGETQTTYGGFRALSSAGPPSATDLQAFALGVRGPDIPFASVIPGISTIPSFGAFLRAVATTQGSDILSTPSVIASDNTPAELKVQLQTSLQPNAPSPSLLASIPGAAGAAAGLGLGLPTTGSVTANYRGIGPRVKVTPHLNESNDVRLDVDETISDIQSAPAPGDTFGTISYVERSATTTLTVQDGHTVVIGGLMRNRTARTETKIPILGDIPILGMLFRTRSDKLEKSNLILVLTPHIVRDDQDMKRIFQRKMDERQELIDHDALFDAHEWSPPKDWAKNRGLLGEIRANVRAVEARRRELAEPPPAPEPTPPTPIDLPVPQGSASPVPTTTPAPAKPKPATEN